MLFARDSRRILHAPAWHLDCLHVNIVWRETEWQSISDQKNRPYVVSGDLSQLEIADADGKKVDISGKRRSRCAVAAHQEQTVRDGTSFQDRLHGAGSRSENRGIELPHFLPEFLAGEPKRLPVPFSSYLHAHRICHYKAPTRPAYREIRQIREALFTC